MCGVILSVIIGVSASIESGVDSSLLNKLWYYPVFLLFLIRTHWSNIFILFPQFLCYVLMLPTYCMAVPIRAIADFDNLTWGGKVETEIHTVQAEKKAFLLYRPAFFMPTIFALSIAGSYIFGKYVPPTIQLAILFYFTTGTGFIGIGLMLFGVFITKEYRNSIFGKYPKWENSQSNLDFKAIRALILPDPVNYLHSNNSQPNTVTVEAFSGKMSFSLDLHSISPSSVYSYLLNAKDHIINAIVPIYSERYKQIKLTLHSFLDSKLDIRHNFQQKFHVTFVFDCYLKENQHQRDREALFNLLQELENNCCKTNQEIESLTNDISSFLKRNNSESFSESQNRDQIQIVSPNPLLDTPNDLIDTLDTISNNDETPGISIPSSTNSSNDVEMLSQNTLYPPHAVMRFRHNSLELADNYHKIYFRDQDPVHNVWGYILKVQDRLVVITIIEKQKNGKKRHSQCLWAQYLCSIWNSTSLTCTENKMPPFLLNVDCDVSFKSDAVQHLLNRFQTPNVGAVCGAMLIEKVSLNRKILEYCQKFEYYISHHMIKYRESKFGTVTCVPGAFSLILARCFFQAIDGLAHVPAYDTSVSGLAKNGRISVSILANCIEVGEDRFLTTNILLQNYTTYYEPKAICQTKAPDDLKSFLSQRRRWLNSTIANQFFHLSCTFDPISPSQANRCVSKNV